MDALSAGAAPDSLTDPPALSAEQIAQFAFCPRAGLLTIETDEPRPEIPPHHNLDFSLPYTLEDLERRLNQLLQRLWIWGLGAVVAAGGVVVTIAVGANGPLLAFGILALLIARPLQRRVSAVTELSALRQEIRQRPPSEPDWTSTERQAVDWWGVLQAGWMSIPVREPYVDEEERVYGRPWRILRKGSTSIPVFKVFAANDSKELAIKPQDEILAAAYCELVSRCERTNCPCAIVLNGRRYEGQTIPFTESLRVALSVALCEAREVVLAAQRGEPDPPPPKNDACQNCRWGFPRVWENGVSEHASEGEPLAVYGTARGKCLYHSHCGDRFQWVPPHEKARRLGLIYGP